MAYDGSQPNGYARQPDAGTVEDALIDALRTEGYVEGSWRTGSRTDKGVAALENVAVCSLDRPHLEGLVPAVCRVLPPGIWLTGAAEVEESWEPRHGAVRHYAYVALAAGEDETAMRAACGAFVGRHDMTGFARVEAPRDPMREVLSFELEPQGDRWVFSVSSPGFLWNQVRRMVDAVLRVGSGSWDLEVIARALEDGAMPDGADIAAAAGLALTAVAYDPPLQWQEAGPLPDAPVRARLQRLYVQEALLRHLSGSQ